MTRIETLRGMYANRRELDVREVPSPEGTELYRISWTQQTLSRRGNSEDRRTVYWRGYRDGEYVYSANHKASVVEALVDA